MDTGPAAHLVLELFKGSGGTSHAFSTLGSSGCVAADSVGTHATEHEFG